MFKTTGKIQVKNGIRIIGDLDMIRYYHRLIEFYTYRTEKLQLPAHGCHVTLVS